VEHVNRSVELKGFMDGRSSKPDRILTGSSLIQPWLPTETRDTPYPPAAEFGYAVGVGENAIHASAPSLKVKYGVSEHVIVGFCPLNHFLKENVTVFDSDTKVLMCMPCPAYNSLGAEKLTHGENWGKASLIVPPGQLTTTSHGGTARVCNNCPASKLQLPALAAITYIGVHGDVQSLGLRVHGSP
jgi:hypothetical protein